MKNILVLACFLLTGCLIRTYTIQKPRVDLNIEGNQGYLFGTPPSPKENRMGDKRTISVVEIELGPHKVRELKQPKERVRKPIQTPTTEETQKDVLPEKISGEKRYQYYTIEKNDTLQKISYKFYGTTKKWKLLYEENKDVIKSSDKIYPGTKIKIPLY